MASRASDLLWRLSAISSRQALPSLSTREGRRASRSKFKEHNSLVWGLAATTGAAIVTGVVVEAVWPRSSATLQVTVMTPVAAPTADRVAAGPVPLTDPAVGVPRMHLRKCNALFEMEVGPPESV